MATGLSQVAVVLGRKADGTYRVRKYYTRGHALISMGMYGEENAQESGDEEGTDNVVTIQYVMDGHGSVTALAKVNVVAGDSSEQEIITDVVIADTYTYDAYGTLLNHTGETDNDYLYTGEQYNFTTKLYYLRARYMSPETGTFISMDTYSGTLDNPVSLHKYLYANANPVMYTDPTGYFSIMETQLA